jgi:hypothetical protein
MCPHRLKYLQRVFAHCSNLFRKMGRSSMVDIRHVRAEVEYYELKPKWAILYVTCMKFSKTMHCKMYFAEDVINKSPNLRQRHVKDQVRDLFFHTFHYKYFPVDRM